MLCFSDIDNLKRIDIDSITEGIVASLTMLVILNDETLDSTWCQHEWQVAKEHNLPIIVVVDIDRYLYPLLRLTTTWLFFTVHLLLGITFGLW
jgi:hypothetical protein